MAKTLSYLCFLGVLIFSPLAFGTVEAWSYAVMEVMIAFCALSLSLSARYKAFYRPPGLVPLLLIAAYLMFQVIPLPPGLVRILSPEAYTVYHQSAGALDGAAWIPLSINTRATVFELARFLSYLVFYVTAVQLLADHARLKRTLAVVAVFAGLLAFLVIVQFITRQLNYDLSRDKIFWIRTSIHALGSIGPYVNRNHYAGLMEMVFPLAVCLFLVCRPGSTARTWKLRLRDFLLHPRINYHFLYGVSALLIGTSVFVSLSRGGIMSLTLSMAALAVWLVKRTKNWKAGLITMALFAGILVLTGSNGWDRIFERFGDIRTETGEINASRLHYWRDGRTIIRHFPLTGSGLGTWRHIYPRFRTFPGISRLEHAHSDYIEFLATGGVILAGLMAMVLFRIIQACYRSYRRRRKRMAVYLFAGSTAAVMSISLHSFVDFNLQVGANGLYFFFVLAIMVSASHTRFSGSSRPTYLSAISVSPRLLRTGAAVFFMGLIVLHGGALMANYHVFDYRDIPLSADLSPREVEAVRRAYDQATIADPLNAHYNLVTANAAAMLNDINMARSHYQRAVRLDPLSVQALEDAGRFFGRQGNMAVAEPLLRAAMDVSHNHISSFLNYAAVLFENNRAIEAMDILTSAMAAEPRNADACLALMAWWGLPAERMKEALPQRTAPYLAFGDFLASLGRYPAAAAAYQEALTYAGREEIVQKDFFIRVLRFYQGRREQDKAREVVEQALIYFPDDVRLRRIIEPGR